MTTSSNKDVESGDAVPELVLDPAPEAADLEAQKVWKEGDRSGLTAVSSVHGQAITTGPEWTETTEDSASHKTPKDSEAWNLKLQRERRLWRMGYALIAVSLLILVIVQVLRGTTGRPGKL